MSRDIDALTSYTLKHLRDRWWTTRWTQWVSRHLRCDPGERFIHVGCGNGEIDVALALPPMRWIAQHVYFHRRGAKGVSFAEFEARLRSGTIERYPKASPGA